MWDTLPKAAMSGRDSSIDIGAVIREHREGAGLTPAELAARVKFSASYIRMIENGDRRVDGHHLQRILDAVGVFPLARDYLIGLATQPAAQQSAMLRGEIPQPEAQDLVGLAGARYPAFLHLPASLDIVAANEATLKAFPGMVERGNLLEWYLLDPRAKHVVVDWPTETHLLVGALHCLSPALISGSRLNEMIETLDAAPEFATMWNKRLPPDEVPKETLTLRDIDTGRETTMMRNILQAVFPTQRPWWEHQFAPQSVVESTTTHLGGRFRSPRDPSATNL